jgi:hypothetical protein
MAQRSRQFRTKNLSVSLAPSGKLAQITDKLRICILHTNLCLGWTQCRLLTHYCLGWISWCRFFTCRGGTLNCDRAYSWVACRVGTQPDPDCGAGSIYADPREILVDPEIYARQVAELRADLQQALTELDAHEKDIADITRQTGGE